MTPPKFPRPPRFARLFPGGNPLREALEDGREAIQAMQQEIRGIRLALRPSTLPPILETKPQSQQLASTDQTIQEVKRRLAKELYRLEQDLAGGARIGGSPCDCGKKHLLGLEATAEELVPMDPNPIYGRLLDWLKEKGPSLQPEAIAKTPPDYYRALSAEVRAFRKEVMGTESLAPMLSPEEKQRVKARLDQELG